MDDCKWCGVPEHLADEFGCDHCMSDVALERRRRLRAERTRETSVGSAECDGNVVERVLREEKRHG
jgi:hypothetical protein